MFLKTTQLIIIDAGHGGLNPKGEYTTAPAKMKVHKDFTFFEGVWNRAIAYTFAQELYNSGRSYVILTDGADDVPLSDRIQNAVSVHGAAKRMGIRSYIACLHGNAFGVETVNGVEVYTSPGHTVSDPLATIYINELEKLGWKMRLGLGDGDPDKEARFTMLTGPEAFGIPSILTEIGFYSNYKQAMKMCQPEIMTMIGQLLRDADARIDELNLLR